MKEKRYYHFNIVTYSIESVNALINWDKVYQYAYICHDKDLNSDGTIKEVHYHLYLRFCNARTCSSFHSIFSYIKSVYGCNCLIEPCANVLSSLQYLTHKNNLDKYQYNEDSVVTNIPNIYCMAYNTDLTPVDCIELGYSPRKIMQLFGRDFIIHYKQYYDFYSYMRHYEELHSSNPTIYHKPIVEIQTFDDLFK